MVGAAGAIGGTAIGVGGYYANKRYKEDVDLGGRGSIQLSWCRIPDGQANAGAEMPCSDCAKVYGSSCPNIDSCYNAAGCSYSLYDDTIRDDVMTAGFVPAEYQNSIIIKITGIQGDEFLPANICPADNTNSVTGSSQWVLASSFNTNLFVTLTEVDNLGSVSNCSMDTHSACTNGNCGTHEECKDGWCMCMAGFCYNSTAFQCLSNGTVKTSTSFSPPQADFLWAPLIVATLGLKAFRRFF
jgi:hypothetical protein